MLLDDPFQVVQRAWGLQDSGESKAAWQLIQPLVSAGAPYDMLGVLYSRIAPRIQHEASALDYIQRLLFSVPLSPHSRAALHAASAALYDRIGDYDRAFDQMRLGKQANRMPYNRDEVTAWIDSEIAYFTPEKLADLPRASHRDYRPIFIVGMPRSGTTLVEQILDAHPLVHGCGEMSMLSDVRDQAPLAPWAEGEPFPQCLDAMGIKQANRLAAIYLDRLPAVSERVVYLTDKMPTNFLLFGLIATLFPDCHVIHCRRDPLDTCLSCYQTAFHPGLDFTHDLTDLGVFYRDYDRLMLHWRDVVNYPLLEVQYESMVRDPEAETRRLLDALELPWDDRCLRFHENKRQVDTASKDQVKLPIYTSSIGRWKKYERHLGELIAAISAEPVAAAAGQC